MITTGGYRKCAEQKDNPKGAFLKHGFIALHDRTLLEQLTVSVRVGNSTVARIASSERSDCVLVVIVDIEQRQEAAHAQGLRNDLWQVRQLYVSSGTFAGLKSLDEEAYAAGIEAIDAGEVEDDLCFSVSGEIVEGLSQRFDRWSEYKPTLYGD